MTAEQRASLKLTAKRWAWFVSLAIPTLGWGFRQYDATNVPTVEFRAYRDSVESRHMLDTLKLRFEIRELRSVVFHTDSAVRKICAAVRGGCQ